MRPLIVAAGAFIATLVFFWLCCAFVSGIINPMAWEAAGRFAFLFLGLTFAIPAAVGCGCWYDDTLRKRR